MKKQLITFGVFLCFSLHAQEWISDLSCNSESSAMINEAITHVTNIEPLVALGLAKAARIVDKNCECSKIVIAAFSSADPNWGSRKSKLESVDSAKLSQEEKAWYDLLVSTTTEDEDWESTYNQVLSDFPNSPLFNWFATNRQDMNSYKIFAEKFPDHAAGAYNMLAYGHAYGEIGDGPDFDSAFELLDKLETLHDGPNSRDSRAEIFAMNEDFQSSLSNQLKAVDFATFASPYWDKATTYWRSMNKEDVSSNLVESQKNMQNAILERDVEEFNKYISDDSNLITGDSNLGDFYTFETDNFNLQQNFTWNSFDLRDFQTHFSPDMKTAVLTFYASGSYTFNESQEEVAYSTRASSVWIVSDSGWKCVHSNWAPYKSGTGIPN
jgi:hypothetical protein